MMPAFQGYVPPPPPQVVQPQPNAYQYGSDDVYIPQAA
jgi:hypothetical protein